MKNIAVIYGGRSAEHEVSLVSGKSIAQKLDKSKFTIREILIDKKGNWVVGSKKVSVEEALQGIDVAFPVLHGTFGEDGKIQGLFEMLSIPYVGCGVAESALGMDKEFSKLIWQKYSLPVVNFVAATKNVWVQEKEKIEKEITALKLPLFVKPANLGSSIGITKVKNKEDIEPAISKAFEYGDKIVVEEAVNKAREIELAVLGNNDLTVSVLGEIIPDREFYDYNSKYSEKSTTKLFIPASVEEELAGKIKEAAKKAYIELGLYGLARVDFLLDGQTNEFYVNEVNTMPGFTPISMYPKLMEASGVKYTDLLTKLISLGEEKFNEKQNHKVDANS